MIKNNLQWLNIDFNKTFTIIIKLIAFKILFAIIVYLNKNIYLINIKIIFLN